MRLDELGPREGSRRARKRVGRGRSGGQGKTAGRGQKGQGARSGKGPRPGFEGGQTPLHLRTPKLRGPHSRRSRGIERFRKDYAIVNVGALNGLAAKTEVTQALLVDRNLCRDGRDGLRVLGDGDLTVALTIHAVHFSATAREKIEAAGGRAIVLGGAEQQE